MKSGTTKWLIIGAVGAGIAWFLLGKPHSIHEAETGIENLLHGKTSHANYGHGWGGYHGGFHGGGWGGGRGWGFRGYGYPGFYGGYPAPVAPFFPQVPAFGGYPYPYGFGGRFGYGRPHHLGARFV